MSCTPNGKNKDAIKIRVFWRPSCVSAVEAGSLNLVQGIFLKSETCFNKMSVRTRSRSISASLMLKKVVIEEKPVHYCSNAIGDYEMISSVGVIDEISHGFLARYKPAALDVTLKMTDLSMSTDYCLLMELIVLDSDTS